MSGSSHPAILLLPDDGRNFLTAAPKNCLALAGTDTDDFCRLRRGSGPFSLLVFSGGARTRSGNGLHCATG